MIISIAFMIMLSYLSGSLLPSNFLIDSETGLVISSLLTASRLSGGALSYGEALMAMLFLMFLFHTCLGRSTCGYIVAAVHMLLYDSCHVLL